MAVIFPSMESQSHILRLMAVIFPSMESQNHILKLMVHVVISPSMES
jgi:hypothetical protein